MISIFRVGINNEQIMNSVKMVTLFETLFLENVRMFNFKVLFSNLIRMNETKQIEIIHWCFYKMLRECVEGFIDVR